MSFNVKIEELPPVTVLSGTDVLVLNKENSYTAKVEVNTLKEYVLDDLRTTLTYKGDEVTIGLSSNNAFFVKPSSIDRTRLTADLQELLDKSNQSGNSGGATITGTLTTFSSPVTATGEFIIVAVGSQYRAIRMWSYQ